MAHVITDRCIGEKNTACVDVCPTDAIHPTKDEPDFESVDKLHIHPDDCIDCGLCIDECPVQAIFAEENVPDDQEHQLEAAAAYYASR